MSSACGPREDSEVFRAPERERGGGEAARAVSSACGPREDSEVFRAPERERVGVGPHAQ
jgi:hypothetical protein